MKWEGRRQSSNIDDRRGSGGGMFGGSRGGGSILGDIFGGGRSSGGINFPTGSARPARSGGFSLWTIVIIGAVMWFVFGINPLALLGGVLGGGGMSMPGGGAPSAVERSGPPITSAQQDQLKQFTGVVLAETEDTWNKIFQASNRTYEEPQLVLYTGATQTACGTGQAAMGPFYCPGDKTVYIDLDFFSELSSRFGAAGDFAQAYVIAHEVGHHVQTLLGISTQVQRQRAGVSEEEGNQLSVRQELQADCFAGVWAAAAQRAQILEPGDIEEALRAASAVGDDTIQKRGRGYVVPESFTHGTAAQRQKWFTAGFQSGDVNSCDTFGVANP